MKRAIVATALLAALGSGAAVADENPSGLYLGAGVGQFDLKINSIQGIEEAVERLDDSDTSWQVFAGWRFLPYLAVQVAYIDYGRPSDTVDGNSYESKLTGFAPSVIGILPLGPVELSAKVGYYFYDLEITANLDDPINPRFESDDSNEDLMYGVGVGITLFEHLNAKLEYEQIDLDNVDDSYAFWLTGAWRF